MTDTGSRRFLGIHGVGNFRPTTTAENMAARWTEKLCLSYGGPLDLRVTYWSPLMRTPVGQGTTPSDGEVAESDLFAEWLGAVLPADETITVPIAQGRSTAWLRNALSKVATKYDVDLPLMQLFVSVFFPELGSYLAGGFRDVVRDAHIHDILEHRPDVLLAHSLGTVVAYESLWKLCEDQPDLRVPLLITYGSPLALSPWVMDRLVPSIYTQPPRRPPNVDRWVNIADVGDVIAIPRHLGSLYADVEHHETQIARWDFHKVGNYLADPINTRILGEKT